MDTAVPESIPALKREEQAAADSEGREKAEAVGRCDEQEKRQDSRSGCQNDLELLPAGPGVLLGD